MDPKLLEEFFFEAALRTYAIGAPKSTIAELPQSKVYRYERGDLLYVDMYWTNGEFSGGKTLIYASNVPVWMMDYDGWCKNNDKRVSEFLKQALCMQYASLNFYGGRGPREFYETDSDEEVLGLVYCNCPEAYRRGFTCFQGQERIFKTSASTTDLLWHRYKGLLLFGDGKAI